MINKLNLQQITPPKMKKNTFADLTNESLIKKRNLLKGITIGFGIFFIITLGILVYLFATKGLKNTPIVTLIPVFSFPLTMVPTLINLSLLNKEIKSRNL